MAFHPQDQFDFGLGYIQGHGSNPHPQTANPNMRIHRSYVPGLLHQSYLNQAAFPPSFAMQGMPYYNPLFGGAYVDDFEEGGEIATRPRLTKEQVDLLEGEFMRNPKPNSSHKRDLALQTGLEPNRVSNWFQNRRAKAKQQRKQAEYQNEQQKETKQEKDQRSPARTSARNNVQIDEDEEDEEDEEETNALQMHSASNLTTTEVSQAGSSVSANSTSPAEEDMKQKSYDSLQRALKAAGDAQAHKMDPFQWSHVGLQMPAEITSLHTDTSSPQSSYVGNPVQNLLTTSWMHQHADQQQQLQHPVASGDFNFDFGFDTSESRMRSDSKPLPSPTDSASQSVVSPGDWAGQAITPTMARPQNIFHQPLQSPGLPTPTYSSSRRGSTTEGLTSNFEGFAIDTSHFNLQALGGGESYDTSDSGNDIASRRRRPRPAALTSASLRSRSYGQLGGQSPTTRQGMPTVTGQSIRHVKSTGHSLHNHYAGIRKSSLPQRSPLNVSTFAEADLQLLLAQRAAGMASGNQSMKFQQDQSQAGCMIPPQVGQFNAAMSGQRVQSPPVTPYQQDFFLQSNGILPPSVQAQYARMPDYTPPYSAGPMTNSSWSDAPLTSPELTNFPQMTFVPSLTADAQCDDGNSLWHLSSDVNIHSRLNIEPESKKAQFRIETFPNQEQEHAQISQHFNRTRPNHFVFQHFGQGDFSPKS